MRQGFAGLLWSKQFYHSRREDLAGGRSRPRHRLRPRGSLDGNADSQHLSPTWSPCPTSGISRDAAWDLAFHCVPLALVDPSLPRNTRADAARVVHAPERATARL